MEQRRLGNSDLDVSVLGYGHLGLDANDGPAADRPKGIAIILPPSNCEDLLNPEPRPAFTLDTSKLA